MIIIDGNVKTQAIMPCAVASAAGGGVAPRLLRQKGRVGQ
jgi:hypothetical protein